MDGLTQLKDEDVVRMVQTGNKDAFGELMKRYYKKLVRYGRHFLSTNDAIEDIVQDVFINSYQKIQSFDTTLTFSSWIYRIAHNAFINSLKRRNRGTVSYFDLDTLVSHPIYEDPKGMEEDYVLVKKMIERGLEKLAPKFREALVLHFLEEKSYREISDILEIPIGTVGVRVMRGRAALKKVYKDLDIHYGEQS